MNQKNIFQLPVFPLESSKFPTIIICYHNELHRIYQNSVTYPCSADVAFHTQGTKKQQKMKEK